MELVRTRWLPEKRTIDVISRRDILAGATAVATLGALLSLVRTPASAAATEDFEALYSSLIEGGEPVAEHISLKMDDDVENGAMAFFRITVVSRMTEQDYIKTIHLLSTENPFADVATYHLTPASGKAQIAGRMRLAKSQDVVALAERSDGQLLVARRWVKVAIGGCGAM
jgi:sulfur-oxidizing protein SoxY